MKENNFTFGTFCAICSAVTSFLFGAMCTIKYFTDGDFLWIPFAILGVFGSLVIYANRK